MALRVLLADESTTIKKVMQLALQDYGVEVKSVPIGLDVVPVSQTFKPDIVFVDVLLQKKAGYEVVKDVKTSLPHLPVVLMWSSFMELDEAKAAECGADRRLEKPFDAEVLRAYVKDLVAKVSENVVSSYLNFPPLPDFEEPRELAQPAAPNLEPQAGEISKSDIYALPEVDENEVLVDSSYDQFQTVPLATSPSPAPERTARPAEFEPSRPAPRADAGFDPKPVADEGWSHQDLSKFKIDVPAPAADDFSGDLSSYMIPAEDLNLAKVESTGDFEEVTFVGSSLKTEKPAPETKSAPKAPPPPPRHAPVAAEPPRGGAHDQVLAEKILREEARAALEKIAWQILPDICERVVREELNKLLKRVEGSI